MSRSGYHDDLDNWDLIRWRGQVASSIRGQRGQKLLKELAEAMDAMEVKELIDGELVNSNGQYCALGIVGKKRGICIDDIDPEDSELVAARFDIAEPLAKEIVYMNDDYHGFLGWNKITPAERWTGMRQWVSEQIKP